MSKHYTIEELKAKLEEFYDNHPARDSEQEWYGDEAWMTYSCSAEFIFWLETGKYEED